MRVRMTGLICWFLSFGALGLLVAITLASVASYRVVSPRLLMTLWPSSIIGIADPTEFWSRVLFGVIEFGGNFLLYGSLGTVLGFCVLAANSRRRE